MPHGTAPIFLTLLLLAAPAIADGLTDEERADLEWFAGLGFPDVSETPFVRVQTGGWVRHGGGPRQPIFAEGFLTGESGDRFDVLLLYLEETRYERKPAGTPELERVEFEPLDFAEEMRTRLREREFELRVTAILLASAAAGRGDEETAHALFDLARKARDWRKGSESWPLRRRLAEDLSELWMWRAIRAFGDPETSRPEILAICERLTEHVPDTTHAERAKETAALLRKMIAEDEAHAKTAKPLAELTGEGRIRELIFRLRDQNGHQWSQPGSCDVFADPREEESPAHRLAAAGHEAVPLLIEAIEDERFSRSVGFWRDFAFSHYVLRVGDCALAVLRRISGKAFYMRTSTSGAMWKDGHANSTRAAVEAWWAEVSEKGEEQVLAEGVAAGRRDSVWQARVLVERFPDSALAAIAAGVEVAEQDWIRVRLIVSAGRLEGDAPVPFLLDTMKSAPDLSSRVAAARALLRRDRAEAIAAMIAEWGNLELVAGRIEHGVGGLVSFLARSGRAEAIEALARDADRLPVVHRYKVVESLFSAEPSSPAAEAAVTDLLFAALADERPRTGISASMGGKSFADPRICDLAGLVLNHRDPVKYAFDIEVARAAKDRAIRALRNSRRRDRGLPPLPDAEIRGIRPVSEEEVLALVLAVTAAPAGPDRDRAVGSIEAKGIGALPALVGAVGTVEDGTAKDALAALAGRMASIVRETRADRDSLPLPGPLAGMLTALEGGPITAERLRTLLLRYVKHPPEGTPRLRLTLVRGDDLTGVTVALALTRPAKPLGGPPTTIHRREHVSLEGRAIHGVSGAGTWSSFPEYDGFEDLGASLEKALASPPKTGFELVVTLWGSAE